VRLGSFGFMFEVSILLHRAVLFLTP